MLIMKLLKNVVHHSLEGGQTISHIEEHYKGSKSLWFMPKRTLLIAYHPQCYNLSLAQVAT